MKYIPCITGIEAELTALVNQDFSTNIIPFIQFVKDKKSIKTTKSILDEYEELIKNKQKNIFIVTVPRNLDLTKALKSTIERFFKDIVDKPDYHAEVINRFTKYNNVIPTIEVNIDDYKYGDLRKLKQKINNNNGTYCYKIEARKLDPIIKELEELITKNDILVYDIHNNDFFKNSIKKERLMINEIKKEKHFRTIALKQIYSDLTFYKIPNSLIEEGSEAFDCIDFDFYNDFKDLNFDYFGDWAGIRNNPIYEGGRSYPGYITIEMDTLKHHGFRGVGLETSSYSTTLLPNYLNSDHWNKILTDSHKENCYGCYLIKEFDKNPDENPNSALKWKTVTISHFIETMDYKINHSKI